MLIVPGDEDCRSAGSFFKNPLVSAAEADRIQALAQRLAPDKALPRYPGEDGQVKLSAAWLVERSGFARGYGLGDGARISAKHTLALVNSGPATTAGLLALARHIRDGVRDAFGVSLTPEPVLVGVTL